MPELKRSLAVVIGINQYVNGIPALKTAVNDAKRIAQILETKYQYQVLRLLDEDATGVHLRELFAAFEQQTLPLPDGSKTQIQKDDRLLFYFAGHGIALDALDNADGPVGFLVPQDARMDNDSSLLPMKRLHDALLALPCRHLLVILDCCFAGAFRWAGQRDAVRSQKMYRERYERFISGCAQQVITSAADDEKAADSLYRFGQRSEHEGHSPFAELLLKGLSGEADFRCDGVITATELYVYIHGELGNTSVKQTPGFSQLKRHDKGEYIFPIPGFKANTLEEAPKLDEKANPYKGLESFEESDSHKFFGRKALIETLQEFVANHPLTVVLGTSGSGKSSLVKAGLIPQLKKEPEQWRVLDPIRPGESPFRALNHALERENLPVFAILNKPTDDLTSRDASKKGNNSDTTLWYEQGLQNLSSNLVAWRELYPNSKLLLVIDQSEELVTLSRDEVEREMFLNGLARALKAFPDWLRIALTLRSDFEPQFRETALEPYWSGARFIVPAMTREELRQAIVEPATAKVMYFEPPKLVDQLIDEVVQMPGALPLLSFTLSELYLKYIKNVREGKRNNRAITQEDYEELGGVARSLTQRADCEYEELKKRDSAYEQTMRHVMLRMVAVGEGELARRRVLCTELEYPEPENARVKEVIERFVAARLLVKGRDIENQEYVEPAHDVLVRGWQKLLSWKQQEQENLILQRRLTPAALEWKSQQQAKFLWNADPRLDLLKQVLNSSDNWFNTLEAEFVRYSVQRRRNNRRYTICIVSGVMASLSGLTIFAFIQLQFSTLREKAATVGNLLDAAPVDGLVLAIQAIDQNRLRIPWDILNPVKLSLLDAVQVTKERDIFTGHKEDVREVAFSPNGKMIVSGSGDNSLRLWDLQGNPIGKPFQGHTRPVTSVAFSPDEKMIVSGSEDNTVRLWNTSGKPIGQPLRSHTYPIQSVAISPDGKMIVSGSEDNTVRLWDISGKLIGQLVPDKKSPVWSVAISPDGKVIASGRNDGIVHLWDISGKLIGQLVPDKRSAVLSVAFSRDGQTIVTGNYNNRVRLWDTSGNPIGQPLLGHTDVVQSVAISPDGKMIISGSDDKTVRLWDISDPIGKPLEGHKDKVQSVAISSDGKMIISGSDDKTVRLWDISGKSIGRPLEGHKDKVQSVAISADGKMIISGSDDNTVRLWNISGNPIRQPLQGHTGTVRAVAISADGKMIISGSDDKTVRLWNISGNPIRQPLQGHTGAVKAVAFSPDGKMIISGSDDNTVRLWNISGNPIGRPFSGHTRAVSAVAFSPDGKMIVSGSIDRTVRLWDTSGNSIGQLFSGHTLAVTTVAISPNGKIIVSGSHDKTIQLWPAKWEDWLEVACNQLQYHPVLQNLQTSEQREAKNTCKTYFGHRR
jgi:WD40 repeat protein